MHGIYKESFKEKVGKKRRMSMAYYYITFQSCYPQSQVEMQNGIIK